MNEKRLKAMNGFIKWLKNEEEFSGEEIDKLREISITLIDLFIRFEEEK